MMEPQEKLENNTLFWSKLMVLFGLILMGLFLFPVVAILLCRPIFGLDFISNFALLEAYEKPNVINALMFIQVFYAFGLFALPALTYAQRYEKDVMGFLHLRFPSKMGFWMLLCLAGYALYMPLASWLQWVNMELPLADWMVEAEEKAAKSVGMFLQAEGLGDLGINILFIALIPAVCEELFFRGLLQSLFIKTFKKPHVSIWIVAGIFSFFHFQFAGFLPRMFLGAYLGYLAYFTRSTWTSIWAHFINNTVAVVGYYFMERGYKQDWMDDGYLFPWYLTIVSTVLTIGLVILASKNGKSRTKPEMGEDLHAS